MSARTLISEEEYLRMPFEDREMEYVDGELVERSLPNYLHSRAQRKLVSRFDRLGERLPLHPCPELRLRVAPDRYRVLDLAVYVGDEPTEAMPTHPPLVAIEIVSPDDRYDDLMQRLHEYHTWGIPNVWLVDPQLRRFSVYGSQGLLAVAALELPEFGVRISPEEIFA